MCLFANNSDSFFGVSYAPYKRRIFAKLKYNTETNCLLNSSETAQQNFVKLASYEVDYM